VDAYAVSLTKSISKGIRVDRIVDDLRGIFQGDAAILEELGI
jgi:hypothetical protein